MAKQSRFFIGEALRSGWETFWKQWPLLLGLSLVVVVLSFLPNMVMPTEENNLGIVGAILYIAFFILQLIVGMGMTKVYLKLSRGEAVGLKTLVEPWPYLVKYIVGILLAGIISLLGFLLFIIPGVMASLMFMYVPYLIIDKGMGPIEALKASKDMTDGVKWDLLGFGAVSLVVTLLGLLALGIGVLVAAPVVALAGAGIYNTLLAKVDD